ncbi:MAG TPA: periplasmic heavy metal sensor [Pyrinomonadaceae bacterium]|nr:periplasmic heavy metal sensor [Pyrinomonadaceae bacterium]
MKLTATLFIVLFLAMVSPGHAQDVTQQQPPDPIEQLGLTPEQRQRIRMIVNQTKEERQTTNLRVRQANIALDQALDAEPIDEALVDQRVAELAAAQSAQLRMRIQMEMRIRRELSPEQLATLRRLRLQVRDVMGAQRPLNQRNATPLPPRRNLRRP